MPMRIMPMEGATSIERIPMDNKGATSIERIPMDNKESTSIERIPMDTIINGEKQIEGIMPMEIIPIRNQIRGVKS